jgi:hypothetical protein
MTTSLSDSGLVLASGNLIDLRSTVPSSGSYTAGDIVLENSTTAGRISGWRRLTTGSGHVLNTDWVYFNVTNINSGTAVATTSGTSIDFTGIPSGVKRITVIVSGVSTSGTSTQQVQLGSGSFTTSGYTSDAVQASSAAAITITQLTTGFYVGVPTAANATFKGTLVLSLLPGNTWVCGGTVADSTNNRVWSSGGNVTLSGTLDRLRLIAANGTDTYDAGSANLFWEF